MIETLPRRAWIPALATFANIAAGFLAIVAAGAGEVDLAVYLMLLAILLDSADGRLARGLGATSQFGKELDSLCDAVAFGAAPAFLAYQAVLHEAGELGLALAAVYLLCAVFRLARFNVLADEHVKSPRTVGTPTPIAAGYMMALALMRDDVPLLAAAAVVAFFAYAMVTRWRLPDLGGGGVLSAMLVVGLFNFLAVVIFPSWYTVGWWTLWNGAILTAGAIVDRRAAVTA